MRRSITRLLASTRPRQIAVTWHWCPLCSGRRFFVRLADDEVGVRCVSCRASPVTLSLVSVLLEIHPDLATRSVYELSRRGPLFDFLQRKAASVTGSEYLASISPGDYRNGIQCQDVQALTYADHSFDICTSTEVFEHVPDDGKGFAEIHRVLKPGGTLVFTVPLDPGKATIERCRRSADGAVEHLLPPEYHGDPVGEDGRILAYRNYGVDIVDRLHTAGFDRAEIRYPRHAAPWGYRRAVVAGFRR